MELPSVDAAISATQFEYGLPDSQLPLLNKAMSTLNPRLQNKDKIYETMLNSALKVAGAPTTHVGFLFI
jgi:hypothetical protein